MTPLLKIIATLTLTTQALILTILLYANETRSINTDYQTLITVTTSVFFTGTLVTLTAILT